MKMLIDFEYKFIPKIRFDEKFTCLKNEHFSLKWSRNINVSIERICFGNVKAEEIVLCMKSCVHVKLPLRKESLKTNLAYS